MQASSILNTAGNQEYVHLLYIIKVEYLFIIYLNELNFKGHCFHFRDFFLFIVIV